MIFATIEDLENLWRPLQAGERDRAVAQIALVSNLLRHEADKGGKDLDKMADANSVYADVVKSVIVDIVARILLTKTDGEPMQNITESALGYSYSGTFLNPGGGVFIKKSELSRLGLRRQRKGVIEL